MSSGVVRGVWALAALLAVSIGVAWRLRERPAEAEPRLPRELTAFGDSIAWPQVPALEQERTRAELASSSHPVEAAQQNDPANDATGTLDPTLVRRLDKLQANLEAFRMGPTGLAADQLVCSIVLAECEALRRFEAYPVDAQVPSTPWDEDYREIHSSASNGEQRVYRFSRYDYPEFWTYVIEPAQPNRGTKPKLFEGAKPLDDIQRDTLIQRAEQVLIAVGARGGK